jgi:hypothetical protein
MKKMFYFLVFVVFLAAYCPASDLSFNGGVDAFSWDETWLTPVTVAGEHHDYFRFELNPEMYFYIGVAYGDVELRFIPIVFESAEFQHFLGSDSATSYIQPDDFGMCSNNSAKFYAIYKNSNIENEGFKFEELIFGDKRNIWSNAEYFTSVDPLNYQKDFYRLDDYRNGTFGIDATASLFNRDIYAEIAAVQNENEDLLILRLNKDIDRFNVALYGGVAGKYITGTAQTEQESRQLLGLNLSYSPYNNSKIFVETATGQIYGWPFNVTTIAGTSFSAPDSISITAEVGYISGSFGAFSEISINAPFGWNGWLFRTNALYRPQIYDNLETLFTIRNIGSDMFQYEFRYGYESDGVHRVDVDLHFMWGVQYSVDKKELNFKPQRIQ